MSRRPLVPEAKKALDKIKTEYANEIGMKYNDGYKGDSASQLNGHIGRPIDGAMVKKMIEAFEKELIDK